MAVKKIFDYTESPYHPGHYIITINCDDFHLYSTNGSFNVICARLMELDYPNYLRFCRDILGATIIGKNTLYPTPYFTRSNEFMQFLKLLNGRAAQVLFDRENPDHKEHAKVVNEFHKELEEREQLNANIHLS